MDEEVEHMVSYLNAFKYVDEISTNRNHFQITLQEGPLHESSDM
jgi:hypothetical protein